MANWLYLIQYHRFGALNFSLLWLRLPFWAQNPLWGRFVAAFQHVMPTKTTASDLSFTRYTHHKSPNVNTIHFWSIFDVTSPVYPGYIPTIKTGRKQASIVWMNQICIQVSKCLKKHPTNLRPPGCAGFETKQWVNEGSKIHNGSIIAQGVYSSK